MGKEILVQYHVQSQKWYQLEIPQKIAILGKAVDALVVNDSMLIAIDNIISPQYVSFYNLNSAGKLEFLHFRELESNSSYEDIYQCRITPEYLGIRSTTMNHGYMYEHITIYADLDLKKSFAISSEFKQKGNFTDFILFKDKLFIANRKKGLGVFEIKNSCFKKSKDESFAFNTSVSENKIKYTQFKNEEIIRLTKIPNEFKIILTIKSKDGKIRYEIIGMQM